MTSNLTRSLFFFLAILLSLTWPINMACAEEPVVGFIPVEKAITETPSNQSIPSSKSETVTPEKEDVPYWQQPEKTEPEPYWLPKNNTDSNRPYWLDEAEIENSFTSPQEVDPVKADNKEKTAEATPEKTVESGLFAPPPPPPPPLPPVKAKVHTEPTEMIREITYYMFKDDEGVTYLTDAPADPRYRMFKVQITLSRGLAPTRRLNYERLRPFILKASEKYNVDPALITAVIKSESAFDPKAVSWTGARGLMQLMPKTAQLVGCADSFDPEQNIMGGTKYIRMMLNRFSGDVKLAVAAYNCGPERVAKNMTIPEIPETKNYVKTVLRNYELFAPFFQ